MSDKLETDATTLRARVERRDHERVRLRVAVEIDSVTSFFGFSTDVSVAGIRVVADEELPIGSLVDLEFQFPRGEPPVDALGEIQWKRPLASEQAVFAYGIEFLDLAEADERRLADLVRRHAPVVDADLAPEEDRGSQS